MAKLNAAVRRKIPASEFGLPKTRQYPMENKGHAVAAKGRADTALENGHITNAQYEAIVRKANRKLGKTGAKKA